jgi:pyruvate formate lyase activating enzyme
MVIFAGGCNWNCYYCHNRDIINPKKNRVIYSTELLLRNLEAKSNFLDGVVISGGEPTLQPRLAEFMGKIKAACGLPIKLDTNGTDPDALMELIRQKLVDFIAMDVKAPAEKYEKIVGAKVDLDEISRSMAVIKLSGVDYEFRTTFCPELTKADVIKTCDWISQNGKARRFALQQYRPPKGGMELLKPQKAHSKELVQETFDAVRSKFGVAVLRGL